jgi:YVTN family beta-propeller protein
VFIRRLPRGRSHPASLGAGLVLLALGLALPADCSRLPGLVAEASAEQATTAVFRTTPARPLLRVVARAEAGVQPKSVRVSPDGRFVYVCNFGRRDREGVTVHDATTLERVGTIDFPGNAVESAFSPDGRTLYVSNFRRNVVEVIDTATRRVRSEISVGQHPKSLAVSPDGAWLYATDWAGRQLSVVDLRAGTEVRRVRTGVHPRGLVVRPDGRFLVASFQDSYVQEFAAGGARELRRFRTCDLPRHLALGPDPNRLFVTCTLGSVGLYDLGSTQLVGMAGVGYNPRTMDVSRDGRWVATANFGLGGNRQGGVTVVDLTSRTEHTTVIPHVERVVGLSIHPGPSLRVFVTSWETREVIALAP